MKIDWTEAPKGTTHKHKTQNDKGGIWERWVNNEVYHWIGGDWRFYKPQNYCADWERVKRPQCIDDATPAEWDAASRAARDLKWLAENVKEWAEGATGIRRDRQEGWYAFVYGDCNSDDREWFTKAEWLNAIGDSEYLKIAQERMNDESVPVTVKQLRYLDNDGRDWIDECAATMTVDEFRGAMKFTIGKYVRRAGKKDAIESEIRKIEDYARRWAEYERDIELEERK